MNKSFGFMYDMTHKCHFFKGTYATVYTPRDEQAQEFIEKLKNDVLYDQDWAVDMLKGDTTRFKIEFTHPNLQGTWAKIKADVLTEPQKQKAGKKHAGKGVTDIYIEEAQDHSYDSIGFILPTIRGQTIEGRKKTISYNGTVRYSTDWYVNFANDLRANNASDAWLYNMPTCEVDESYNIVKVNTPRITASELEQDKMLMGLPMWLANYCLLPMDKQGGVFDDLLPLITVDDIWADAEDIIIAGVDLGKDINNTVICEIRNNNGVAEVFNVKQFPLGTSYDDILDWICQRKLTFPNFFAIGLDETGAGAKVVSDAKKKFDAVGLRMVGNVAKSKSREGAIVRNLGIKVSAQWNTEVMHGIVKDMQGRLVKIPKKFRRLLDELLGFTWDDLRGKPTGKSSPDALDAFKIAMYVFWESGFRVTRQQVQYVPLLKGIEASKKKKKQIMFDGIMPFSKQQQMPILIRNRRI